MFSIEQIKEAHSKVKSGADFPAYIKELKSLGVVSYDTYVIDGHTDFVGNNNYQVSSPAKYETLIVTETSQPEKFKADLKAHQQGETDYPTFCKDCAKSGIEKWTVSIEKMSCTYYDKSGEEILAEQIPQ